VATGDPAARDNARREIVVIGASAGGVEALSTIATALPSDFAAAVLVVLHMPMGMRSGLAEILDRAGPLPAAAAVDGQPIEAGRIIVAPPDHHLALEPGFVRLLRGPRINGYRPSVDLLFHSAARVYGASVVGVVLSGTLDDGTLGLRAIKRRNGLAVVQSDAMHEGMPTSAIENVDVDFVVPVGRIAETLSTAVDGQVTMDERSEELSELEAGFDLAEADEPPGSPSPFRCPECGGALWELQDDSLTGYACHVGHAYSADSLVNEQSEQVERALWGAVRLLRERAALAERLAERMGNGGRTRSYRSFRAMAAEALEQAEIVRSAVLEPRVGDETVDVPRAEQRE
jgi:two-component system chemotaxis response regulator CheB